MSETERNKSLVLNSPEFFEEKRKSLTEKIDAIALGEDAEREIASATGKRILREKVLGAFKIGQIVQAVLTWNENIEKDIKSKKRDVLLGLYFEKNEKNEAAIDKLTNFVTDPQGNTLFNKIIRILDDSPPDIDLAQHLAATLKHITETQFRNLFEQHKYALAQIEQLSPQSLTILADHSRWPTFRLSSYSASGGRLTSDWLHEFTSTYVSSKRITDRPVANRVQHSVDQLIRNRYIQAHIDGEIGQAKLARCSLTEIGQSLLPYLSELQ